VKKAAHAATREKLHDCEAELARMQGRGETEWPAADEGRMQGRGATEGAAREGTEEAANDECDVPRPTSPTTGDDSGGNAVDCVAMEANTVTDEVATAAEATECTAAERHRGQSPCAADIRTFVEMQDDVGEGRPSPKRDDDVRGVSKVGDKGSSDAVREEGDMREETIEGDVAGEEGEAGEGEGGRRSLTLVQRIKQRGRRRIKKGSDEW